MSDSNFIREMLSKSTPPHKFFAHVIRVVERELLEWGHEVIILYDWSEESDDIPISFIIDGKYLSFYIGKNEAEGLQRHGPFFLDRLIWIELIKRGIVIKEDEYMKKVFPKK